MEFEKRKVMNLLLGNTQKKIFDFVNKYTEMYTFNIKRKEVKENDTHNNT